MSGDFEFTRRKFVAGCDHHSGGRHCGRGCVRRRRSEQAVAAANPSQSAANTAKSGSAQLLVFDPEHADACRRIEGGAGAGA